MNVQRRCRKHARRARVASDEKWRLLAGSEPMNLALKEVDSQKVSERSIQPNMFT